MNSRDDYFSLFGLEPGFEVDPVALADIWRELQRVCHPDRVAGRNDREVRLAVQRASLVNQAYEVLKSPVKRALYLLELHGVDPDRETRITRDGDFLMAQMMLRERLQEVEEEADAFSALDALADEAREAFASLEGDFAHALERRDYGEAGDLAAKMQFFSKFLDEIDGAEARLDS